jgi:hypothetical protein
MYFAQDIVKCLQEKRKRVHFLYLALSQQLGDQRKNVLQWFREVQAQSFLISVPLSLAGRESLKGA